jgi:superfamily II DNA/RNA helicase
MALDASKSKGGAVQVLVVAPGRELAAQTASVCSRLLEGTDLRCQALIGGANLNRQLDALKRKKPVVVVGTPGRLAEVGLGLKKLKLSGVNSVVVDEVDDMLYGPSRSDLDALLAATVNRGQRGGGAQLIVASATGGNLKTQLALQALLDGQRGEGEQPRALVSCGAAASSGGEEEEDSEVAGSSKKRRQLKNASPLPLTVEHGMLVLPRHKLIEGVRSLLNTDPYPEAAVVFVNDARRVDVVVQKLLAMNIIAAPLHGDSSKSDRSEVT